MTVQSGSGWRLRPYAPGDELHLVELFQECFGRPMSVAEWRWKLKGLPSPVENVAVAASADDTPIFQIAGLPRRLRTPDGERLAMVAVDAMTAPAYRRQGVLTAVCRETFEAWRAEGVSFVLGLPNEQWGSRTEALGWRPVTTLSWMIRPLQPHRLAAARLGVPALARLKGLGVLWNAPWTPGSAELRARRLDDPDEASAAVMRARSRQSDRAPYGLLRDERWIRWRYFDAPHRKYEVVLVERGADVQGYAVTCVVQGARGRIAYLAEVGSPADDRLFGAVIRVLTDSIRRDSSADAVATLAVSGTRLHRALRRSGYLSFGRPGFEVHGVSLDEAVPLAAVRQPGSLPLVMGDFDGV